MEQLVNFTILDSSIDRSTAAQGGAIGCEALSRLAVVNSRIVDGTAAARGGAVYCDGCFGALTQSQLDGNTAGAYGGAVSAGGPSQVCSYIHRISSAYWHCMLKQ